MKILNKIGNFIHTIGNREYIRELERTERFLIFLLKRNISIETAVSGISTQLKKEKGQII